MAREFVRVRQGFSRDLAAGLRCLESGPPELNDDGETYNTAFELDWESNPRPLKAAWKGFSVAKSLRTKVRKINGVTILENVFGRPGGSEILGVVQLKGFCNFTNSDFEFLQYLGSAVTRADPEERGSFHAFALATEEQLKKDKIEVPQNVRRDEQTRVILFDTANEFVKS